MLILSLLVIFPFGIIFGVLRFTYPGQISGLDMHLSDLQHLISVAVQATFTWVMVCAAISLFRYLLRKESRTWGYISANSYWLFLAHPPFILVAQEMIRTWLLPADIKYVTMLIVTVGIMLLIYDGLARYTPIGRILARYQQQ